jgi:hypothetical protein
MAVELPGATQGSVKSCFSSKSGEADMLAERHRKAAEDLEKAIVVLQSNSDPDLGRMIIEGTWGAAQHWIAYGCEIKHQEPREAGKLSQQSR